MSYGLIIRNARGEVTFTSENTVGGVFACTVTVPPGTSTTIYFNGTGGYPDLRGKTIRVLQTGSGAHSWTVTQAATPYVTLTARGLNRSFSANVGHTVLRVFVL